MPEAGEVESIPSLLGDTLKRQVFAVQDYALLVMQCVANVFTPPQYWGDTLAQMDQIGVGSLPIVVITSFFIGGVMVLQTAGQFQELPEQCLTVAGKVGEIHAALRAADRGSQSNRQHIQQVMPLRITRPRVRQISEAGPDRQHGMALSQ